MNLLADANQALLRLERAPRDHVALLHALRLLRLVREAYGSERVAGMAERTLGRVRDGALVVTPDLITGLLRALNHIEAGAAGLLGDATGIIEALEALTGDAPGNVLERPGRATTVALPPTTPVLIVEAGGTRFALARSSVVEVVRPCAMREGLPSPVNLVDLLRLPQARRAREDACIVVAAGAVGLLVDRVLDAEDAAVKPVAPMLRRSAMFSGSAVLGDGEVVMVLDLSAVASVVGAGEGQRAEPPAAPPIPADHPGARAERERPRPARGAGAGRHRVLLVEDGVAGQSAPPALVRQPPRARPWWAARLASLS